MAKFYRIYFISATSGYEVALHIGNRLRLTPLNLLALLSRHLHRLSQSIEVQHPYTQSSSIIKAIISRKTCAERQLATLAVRP